MTASIKAKLWFENIWKPLPDKFRGQGYGFIKKSIFPCKVGKGGVCYVQGSERIRKWTIIGFISPKMINKNTTIKIIKSIAPTKQ